jgi:hypothetical protein
VGDDSRPEMGITSTMGITPVVTAVRSRGVCDRDLGEKMADGWAADERGEADAWAKAHCRLAGNGRLGSVSRVQSGKERISNSEFDLIIFHYREKELN